MSKEIDKSDELVEITIPKKSKSDKERFISVNGENVLVQTGIKIQLKRKFVEVLEHSEELEAEAERFIEANSKD